MIQEDKDLLLRDLCTRLPYEVKVKVNSEYLSEGLIKTGYDNPLVVYDITADGSISFTLDKGLMEYSMPIISIKPYLFPLSSMTEEQSMEFALLQVNTHKDGFLYVCDCANMMKWLLKNHFDIYGLIPKCLAIDCTNLNIY